MRTLPHPPEFDGSTTPEAGCRQDEDEAIGYEAALPYLLHEPAFGAEPVSPRQLGRAV